MGFPEPFLFGIRSFRHLRGRLHHFDILHDNQSLSYGLWILKKRMPVIATVHHPIAIDRDVAVKSTHSCWKKFKQLRWYSFVGMQNRVTRTLPHLITVSRRSREDFRRILDLPADRFRIIPNGVDSSRFHPLPHLSREPGRLVVTSSADIPLKGLTYLLHAVADLSRNRDLKLVIIGSPKKNGLVKRTVRDLNLSRRVHFTGRIGAEGFAEQYARASLAVVPSIYEGFGLPAIEAMSCGVPVISTTGGALPEVVGKAGILVPPADARALRDAIAFLLDHPAQASALGQAGLQRVRRHFTWENTARLTVEAYREAIVAHHRF
jgi:glycosyltransferase involved in cell wall biosynthesis